VCSTVGSLTKLLDFYLICGLVFVPHHFMPGALLYCIVLYLPISIALHTSCDNMSLSEVLLTTAIDTALEFTCQSTTGNCKVSTWRIELDLNLRPSGRKASPLPMRHDVPH